MSATTRRPPVTDIAGVPADRVRQILGGCRITDRTLIGLPDLPRSDYDAVDQVLSALGGRWHRGTGHRFPHDVSLALAEFVAGGPAPQPERSTAGWVPTPDTLAAKVIADHARLRWNRDVRPGARVLEPSAGYGALVTALRNARDDLRITAVEPVEYRAERIEADEVVTATFEQYAARLPETTRFDLIVMNPPFAVTGDRQAWIAHVRLAMRLLADGGRLVAILPASARYRTDNQHEQIRSRMESLIGFGVTDLGADAFLASGAGVRTVAVAGTKSLRIRDVPSWLMPGYRASDRPRQVQRPRLGEAAAARIPVQVWHDGWRRRDRVLRFAGSCGVCATPTWLFDDGHNDPRGVLGDHAGSPLHPTEWGMRGPSLAMCFGCGNDSDRYRPAVDRMMRRWVPARQRARAAA